MTIDTRHTNAITLSQYSAAVVLGLGATGYSVVRYLRARGLSVAVMDYRQELPLAKALESNFPEVELHLGEFDESILANAGLIIASPGVALNQSALRNAKQQGAQIIGDIELFLQENTKPVIAITGSNGKSTVTTLVGEMCREGGKQTLVAGNIGIPALDALTDSVDYDVAVLELSSFQLEATLRVPAESVAILNISPDHMDRYDSMGSYVLAKARILRGAKRTVLPRHDALLEQITNISISATFDLDEPANDSDFGVKRLSNYRWLMKGESRLMKLRDVPLMGLHNIRNVLSAFALVDFLNIPLPELIGAVKRFTGLPHRMQTVAIDNGLTFVNDSKATNVGATSTALKNIEGDVIWIAGGQGKEADFSELRDAISGNIKLLVLFGEDADKMEAALNDLVPIRRTKSMAEAVQAAATHAHKPSIILLSPACASFDMFDSYEHRGDAFVNQVNAWIDRGAA